MLTQPRLPGARPGGGRRGRRAVIVAILIAAAGAAAVGAKSRDGTRWVPRTVRAEAGAVWQQAGRWVGEETRIARRLAGALETGIENVIGRPSYPTSQWTPPVARYTVRDAFGWQRRGGQEIFRPDVVLSVSPGSLVRSGLNGRVTGVQKEKDGWAVTVASGPAVRVRYAGLTRVSWHAGQLVTAGDPLGTAGRLLVISVWDRGYPVDPQKSVLAGRGWLHG